jgi:site-specific DNA-methyltransferase (adenine-specific)
VLHGDCIEWMSRIEDKSIDMILCDLPYSTKKRKFTIAKWDSVIPYERLWEQYKRIIKDDGAIILTASQPFTSSLVMSNPEWFKYEWIWEKNAGSNFATVKYQPMKEHENILVFGKGKTKYFPIMEERSESGKQRAKYDVNISTKTEKYTKHMHNELTIKMNDLRCPRTVQKFNIPKGKEKVNHPTQKPLNLFEYLIKTYTNEGDIVLDNCIGSGTTAVACVKTNRNFIGIEQEAEYCEIACKRIEEAKNAGAL